jgi:hypothetical protein
VRRRWTRTEKVNEPTALLLLLLPFPSKLSQSLSYRDDKFVSAGVQFIIGSRDGRHDKVPTLLKKRATQYFWFLKPIDLLLHLTHAVFIKNLFSLFSLSPASSHISSRTCRQGQNKQTSEKQDTHPQTKKNIVSRFASGACAGAHSKILK